MDQIRVVNEASKRFSPKSHSYLRARDGIRNVFWKKRKNEKNEQKWPQLKKLEEKDNRI